MESDKPVQTNVYYYIEVITWNHVILYELFLLEEDEKPWNYMWIVPIKYE